MCKGSFLPCPHLHWVFGFSIVGILIGVEWCQTVVFSFTFCWWIVIVSASSDTFRTLVYILSLHPPPPLFCNVEGQMCSTIELHPNPHSYVFSSDTSTQTICPLCMSWWQSFLLKLYLRCKRMHVRGFGGMIFLKVTLKFLLGSLSNVRKYWALLQVSCWWK